MPDVAPIIREQEGNRLRAAYRRIKLRKRITQADLAAACGWQSASTFNRLLSGKITLTNDVLTKLCSVLEVLPSDISPRLAEAADAHSNNLTARMLPVSLVNSVARGSWGEPFLTTQRITYFTADPNAYALVFDSASAPAGLDGWVVVVEPAGKPSTGDHVVLRHGTGKYSFGRMGEQHADGACPVDVAGRGVILTRANQCMLIATLVRKSAMQESRACAEIGQH
ncbi:TPA: helix-turn-helix transcriptional regulator [Pseudomonas aeruginosa]|nr:helix-turn-helix transcriptional regulator [Pseudomonas aeruginosa]